MRSVLAQDPGVEAMQIEVVDNGDHHDDVARLVRDVGGARVDIYRQPVHLPMADNWNTCVLRSRGEFVHILNDDDEVLPDFYAAYWGAANRRVSMIAGQAIEIDETGRWTGVTPPLKAGDGLVCDAKVALATTNVLRTPAVVLPRATYEAAGGFLPYLVHGPDWEMWARAATTGAVAWVTPPRALYRIHANAATALQVRTGENIRDSLRVVELVVARLDTPAERNRIRRLGLHLLAQAALQQAGTGAALGDRRAWWENGLLAARLRPTLRAFITLALAAIRGRRTVSPGEFDS